MDLAARAHPTAASRTSTTASRAAKGAARPMGKGKPAASGAPVAAPAAHARSEDDLRRQPPADPVRLEKPGAGRSTKLGRKVESPALPRTAGPSGQRTRTQEQKRHPNK